MSPRTQPVQSPPSADLEGMKPVHPAPWLANRGVKEIHDGFGPDRGQL